MPGVKTVDEFRTLLTPGQLSAIDALRDLAAEAAPGLVERIKWNGPSFAIGGVDRISIAKDKRGAVRVVLHRGVKPIPLDGFSFDDPHGLADWPAPDRGVMTFADGAEVAHVAEKIASLFGRWLRAS